MDSSQPLQQMARLWQCAAALFDEIQKEPESKDPGGNCRRIQFKFNHVVSNMTCVHEIVAMLFEKDMVTQRERDDIFRLESSPTRANEELLNVIMRKDNKVIDSFLKTLVDTKQLHIYKLLISEVEECPTSHSDIIRRNYKWLVEKLDPSNGLVYFLYKEKVLSIREMESIDSEKDAFKKNDKLLSLISRKCSEDFETFLLALKDTKQIQIYAKFQQSPLPASGSTTDRTRNTDCPRAAPPSTQRAFSVPGTTISPGPPPPPKQKLNFQTKSVTKAISYIREKRTSICSLRKKLPQLCDQHQSEISLKVIAIRQGKNYATGDFLDIYLVKVLKEFDRLKKETQETNQEKTGLRQYMNDFVQTEQTHKADEIVKLKAEVLCKSTEITNISSRTEKQLHRLNAEVRTLRQKIETERTRSNKIKQQNEKLIKEKSVLEDLVRKLKAEGTEQKEVIKRLTENETLTTEHPKDAYANTRLEYKENPTLLKKIEKDTNSKADGLSRLAILENELYVVPLKGHEMEVYDLATLCIKNKWPLEDVENVEDIGSCDQNKCLYIINWSKERKLEEIVKVDRNGVVLKRWWTSEDQGRLSIAHDANIILTVYTKNKLIEYSSDLQLQREINLPSDIKHPQHARKLTNGHFVVSYGSGFHSDTIHGVCIVDALGNVLKSTCAEVESSAVSMNHPMYLAIDRGGNILVADLNNSRVLLLSSGLQFLRLIISEKDGLRHPRRICLDESNCRLIVACGSCKPDQTDSDVGQVLLFDVGGR